MEIQAERLSLGCAALACRLRSKPLLGFDCRIGVNLITQAHPSELRDKYSGCQGCYRSFSCTLSKTPSKERSFYLRAKMFPANSLEDKLKRQTAAQTNKNIADLRMKLVDRGATTKM